MSKRVHFVMPEDLIARIDAALLEGMSRGEFVRRAVEQALGGRPGASVSPGVQLPAPAPAEQPLDELHRVIDTGRRMIEVRDTEIRRLRSSQQAKAGTKPIPKGK